VPGTAVRLLDVRAARLFQPLDLRRRVRQADLGELELMLPPAALEHAEDVAGGIVPRPAAEELRQYARALLTRRA
jgi:hypothetical protein